MTTQRSIERVQKAILSNTLTKTAVIALADWIEDEKRKTVASGVIPVFYSREKRGHRSLKQKQQPG